MRILRRREATIAVLVALAASIAPAADAPQPGKNRLVLRGQAQDVYFLAASGNGPHKKVIYAPGDGGWRGFGITIAEQMARSGYDVYGIDTRRYLQSFANASLKPHDIAGDYRTLAEWARGKSAEKVLIVGWSEGAGMALVAAAEAPSRELYSGVVAIGTTEKNILAWKWSDLWAEAMKTLPNEPTFNSADYIGRVAPLPIFMIASRKDEFVTEEMTKQLFARASNPKKLAMIDAGDHKFTGRTDELFHTVEQGLEWVLQNSR